MSDLVNQVIKNARNQQADFSQRRAAVVRICGEEHPASGNGSAVVYLTLDNDMAYISEMKFKLVLGSGGASTAPTGAGVHHGVRTWANIDAFISEYGVGTAVDTDGSWGAQCWDYANAFWLGQVNRTLQTGANHAAYEIWTASRTTNAGSEFTLITNVNNIKKGDWVVWGGGSYGHVALALAAPSGGKIRVIGQNQGGTPWPTGGASANETELSTANILGAFRYNW